MGANTRHWFRAAITAALVLPGPASAQDAPATLVQARKGHKTVLTRQERETEAMAEPPADLFKIVKYPGPLGQMSAYVSPNPGDGKRHPAIVWITGGFPAGGGGAICWKQASRANDQSGAQYRESGLVMMYPALRGAQGNPGVQETLYGEVDDVIAAGAYLRSLDYVDPRRVYLGGHSTGGTLALLVAEACADFRAVFCLGPIDAPSKYGAASLTYDAASTKEDALRSPVGFTAGITSPTWVIEGTRGNHRALQALQAASRNPLLTCTPVVGANHFDLIAPVNAAIAYKLLLFEGEGPIRLDVTRFQALYETFRQATREAEALETVAALRHRGVDLVRPQLTRHFFSSRARAGLESAATAARAAGYEPRPIRERKDEEGSPYFILIVTKKSVLGDLKELFGTAEAIEKIYRAHDLDYDGWDVE